jgi:hypothetical protein
MLTAAAILTIVLGLAHSILGERFILVRLFRRENLPKLAGGAEFTRQTLRLAWHITTVMAFGFAALLLVPDSRTAADIIAVTMLLCGLTSLIVSRGKHLSRIVFFAIAALAATGCTATASPSKDPVTAGAGASRGAHP